MFAASATYGFLFLTKFPRRWYRLHLVVLCVAVTPEIRPFFRIGHRTIYNLLRFLLLLVKGDRRSKINFTYLTGNRVLLSIGASTPTKAEIGEHGSATTVNRPIKLTPFSAGNDLYRDERSPAQ